jgi:hypothetical protein
MALVGNDFEENTYKWVVETGSSDPETSPDKLPLFSSTIRVLVGKGTIVYRNDW